MILIVPRRTKTSFVDSIERDQTAVFPVKYRPFYKFVTLDKAAFLCMVSPYKMLSILRKSKTLYAFKVDYNCRVNYYIHPDNFMKYSTRRLARLCGRYATGLVKLPVTTHHPYS